MSDENDQLPVARMATISKPSFWIFFLACAVLFNCDFYRPRLLIGGWPFPSLIGICVFAVLFLELLSQGIKNARVAYWLTNAIYVLEASSIIAFAFVIFGR